MGKAAESPLMAGALQMRAKMLDQLLHRDGMSDAGVITAPPAAEATNQAALPKPRKKFDQKLSLCRSRCDELQIELTSLLKDAYSSTDIAVHERYHEIVLLKQAADAELQKLTEGLLAKRRRYDRSPRQHNSA
jgi:hypothetical protein